MIVGSHKWRLVADLLDPISWHVSAAKVTFADRHELLVSRILVVEACKISVRDLVSSLGFERIADDRPETRVGQSHLGENLDDFSFVAPSNPPAPTFFAASAAA